MFSARRPWYVPWRGRCANLDLVQSDGPRGRQKPATAVPEGGQSDTALSRLMHEVDSDLDQTALPNTEMRKDLKDIRAKRQAQSVDPRTVAATKAVAEFAGVLKQQTADAVSQFAVVLKRYQPPRSPADRDRVYMLDLVAGGTTLIAEEPVPGLTSSGCPSWSHNGSRIVFDASPGRDWNRTHVMTIEVRDGRPTFLDLGPGNCPTFSPDDQKIAFLLNPGAGQGPNLACGLWRQTARNDAGRANTGPHTGQPTAANS